MGEGVWPSLTGGNHEGRCAQASQEETMGKGVAESCRRKPWGMGVAEHHKRKP